MNVAARKRRLAKIARPSCTNMPPSAGGAGRTRKLVKARTSTPHVAIQPITRRSAPRMPRVATNTSSRRAPSPISRMNARTASGPGIGVRTPRSAPARGGSPCRRGARALRFGAGARDHPGRHGDPPLAGADRGVLTPMPGPDAVRAFILEIGLGALLLLVFVATLGIRGAERRVIGWIATWGVLVLAFTSFLVRPAPPALGGMFVQDGLAIFAKRLFLAATFIGLLASLGNAQPAFVRRAGEYHLLILSSLLGMFVLASARDLILLFVAFELMSIPLYVLAGFLKRQEEAVEAALKFFLVGSVSSALLVYVLSFVYGAVRSTDLATVARVSPATEPLLALGLLAAFAGFGFKIAAFPFHMWVPDTYEAASTPFVAWLSVAPKAAG